MSKPGDVIRMKAGEMPQLRKNAARKFSCDHHFTAIAGLPQGAHYKGLATRGSLARKGVIF